MGKKPTRKPATQEGQSKEGGTKRQSTVRRHAKVTVSQEEDGTQIETQITKKSAATCEAGVQALADEFLKIKLMGQTNIPPKTAFDANPDKNRYKDVICIDQSRVILTWPPIEGSSDYIHANWAPVRGEKKFICTQGLSLFSCNSMFNI
uniref:Tyrosine-protein phosphatase domain-containing protein n=1 Tax=Panagrolaimus sp. PS1159 TaxID=55785 RepID=A0AC35GH85_9BILA